MATTVGQNTISTITSPQNGDPLDATVVVGNDNTIRVAFNTHDSDSGIHVQSSTLSSRPLAGTSGRKWLTADSGDYKLWYDDGTAWREVGGQTLDVEYIASGNIVKGDVLKLSGWNNGLNLAILTPATSASDVVFAIATSTVTNGNTGYAINTGFLEDVDTSGFNEGDRLYPNGTTGPGSITSWLTTSKPSSGEYQQCAYVLRKNASNGVLFVEFSATAIVESSANTANNVVRRDASGNFVAGTITANLTGNVTGNVTGAVTGNATTATTLATARSIWGQSFDGSANVTGQLSLADAVLERPTIKDLAYSKNALGSSSGAVAINLESGNAITATAAGNITWSFTNAPACGGFVLELTNGGAYTIGWPASVDWPQGVQPVLTASGVDVLAFFTFDGGTTWRGTLSMRDSK